MKGSPNMRWVVFERVNANWAAFVPALVLGLMLFAASAQAVPPGHIMAAFPAPCESPSDLAWDGQTLWVADWREGVLYRISPEDGAVLGQIDAPGYRPEGLAWGAGGDRLLATRACPVGVNRLLPDTPGGHRVDTPVPGRAPRGWKTAAPGPCWS